MWLDPSKSQREYKIIYNGFVYPLETYNEYFTSPIITNEEYLKLIIADITNNINSENNAED
ncbi:MAG: hypothetical protein HWD58_19640 [Bacteroidota bacterium]|nr:MAG: hypothetical protein HWD58_19640 [Bacteroidota bacterium]